MNNGITSSFLALTFGVITQNTTVKQDRAWN
jgi:hypothetical protein